MIVRVPAAAPSTPPLTGESTIWKLPSALRAVSATKAGGRLLMMTRIEPGCAAAA
jgi:hypothetical protein